ncbi:MAG: AMP-binding protein, partial [Actinobacteria bacterium]|nr:AMP-binding protein [Actinomycetota bacterium]
MTGEGLGSRLPASARLIEVEGHTDADADCEEVGPAPAVITPGAGHPGPGDTALVFYGSGTATLPRGVVIEHRSVVNLAIALHTDVYGAPSTGRRVWQSALPTDDAFVRQMTAVLGGHILTVAELAGERQRQVVALVASGDVDVLDGAAQDVTALVGAGLQKALLARPGDAATPIIVVASRQGPQDERLWRTVRTLRRARASVLYGPPECAFAATADCIVDAGRRLGTGERATVGRPLGHVSTRVLGPHGHPVPVQVTGELYLGGQGLARGYVGPPKATDGFVTLGVAGEPQVRLFRTGQRARYLPDGRIELLGAAADNVGFRGFSVDLSRLEAALARCPGVGDVRVVVDDDDAGCERLVAYLVPGTGALPTQAQLRVWLWSQHPGCAWPAAVEVVAATGSPGGAGTEGRPSTPALCGPALAEEAFLAALWAETAGVDRVGPGENYWQSFPFLDVVTWAAEVGVGIKSHQVARNRT